MAQNLERILRSAIPPRKRYMLDLKVENDTHLAEIAKSVFTDGKSLARLLGIIPLKPEEQEDVGTSHKDRYVVACINKNGMQFTVLRKTFEE